MITFGRFQPPHLGHEKLINKIASIASGNKYRIYVSQTNDSKNNPLDYSTKIKFLRKMFSKHGRSIIEDKSVKTILDALVQIYDQDFTGVDVVVGSDRVDEFRRLLTKYNGVDASHGYYEFPDGIKIVSSGERDPDSENEVEGVSSTKMRQFAIDDNLTDFSKGLPKDFNAVELFNAVRNGLGIKENRVVSRRDIKLPIVSETRENFVKGNLFKVGDSVTINEGDGTISKLGPNFVVVDTSEKSFRKWLTDVTIKKI